MMSTQGPVIVGYDGSQQADKALEAAANHARMYGTSLKIVTAYDDTPSSFADGMFGISQIDPEIIEASAQNAEDLVQKAQKKAQEIAPDIAVDTSVVVGRPSQALVEAAENASLIVVGAHGDTAWKRLLLGSTSTEVIHHAGVPVLVIR
ncbi:MAG: universal stress protein [Micrococcaceae bacterium]